MDKFQSLKRLVDKAFGWYKAEGFKVVMPEEGWGDRIQEFHCEWCGPQRHHSIYMNVEGLGKMGMTPEDFALAVHNNDHHRYDKESNTWFKD